MSERQSWTPERLGPKQSPATPPPPTPTPTRMLNRFPKPVEVDLFTMRLRGDIAGLFMARGETPCDRWLAVIRGERDPTMRDLAELAWNLDVDVVFVLGDKWNM